MVIFVIFLPGWVITAGLGYYCRAGLLLPGWVITAGLGYFTAGLGY
jgi:hypothetical protein